MRVVELRDRLGFALEALTELGVGSDVGGQDLDCDGTVEPRVLRPIHLSHAARTNRCFDGVGTEPGAGV